VGRGSLRGCGRLWEPEGTNVGVGATLPVGLADVRVVGGWCKLQPVLKASAFSCLD